MSDKKFHITTMFKIELARAYGIRTVTLREWLKKNKNLWKILDYDAAQLLTPKKVQLIIDHLGEPEIIN